MKRAFLIFAFCFLAGCSHSPVEGAVEKKAVKPPVTVPQAVIRSGRKDPLLKADYVLQVLGQPDVKRREVPSEVWAYTEKDCVLFIYLADQDEGAALVRHMEIGTSTFQAKEKDSLPCLRAAARLR